VAHKPGTGWSVILVRISQHTEMSNHKQTETGCTNAES